MTLHDQIAAISCEGDALGDAANGKPLRFHECVVAALENHQCAGLPMIRIGRRFVGAFDDHDRQQLSIGTDLQRFGGDADGDVIDRARLAF